MQVLTRALRRDRDRTERGAAAVEFALTAMLLFTLLFGIIQFGIWFWAWQQTAHAAREASRVAAVSPKCTSRIVAAGQKALEGAPATLKSVTPAGAAPTKIGDTVTVNVTAKAIDLRFFPFFNPNISKDATSRVENIPSGTDCP